MRSLSCSSFRCFSLAAAGVLGRFPSRFPPAWETACYTGDRRFIAKNLALGANLWRDFFEGKQLHLHAFAQARVGLRRQRHSDLVAGVGGVLGELGLVNGDVDYPRIGSAGIDRPDLAGIFLIGFRHFFGTFRLLLHSGGQTRHRSGGIGGGNGLDLLLAGLDFLIERVQRPVHILPHGKRLAGIAASAPLPLVSRAFPSRQVPSTV